PPGRPPPAVSRWTFEPVPTIGIVLAAVLYIEGLRTLRMRRLPGFPLWRVWCFTGGLAVLFLTLTSPIDGYATLLLSDHMLQHILITMAAAPLLVLGTPVLLALRAASTRSRRRILIPLLHSGAIRILASPLLGFAA